MPIAYHFGLNGKEWSFRWSRKISSEISPTINSLEEQARMVESGHGIGLKWTGPRPVATHEVKNGLGLG